MNQHADVERLTSHIDRATQLQDRASIGDSDHQVGHDAGSGDIRSGAVERLANRLAPRLLRWALFPGDGLTEPLAEGNTIFDFREQKVYAPNETYDFEVPFEPEQIQNLIFAVDQYVRVTIEPGPAQELGMPRGILEADARDIRRLRFDADTPFLLQLGVGTGLQAIDLRTQPAWYQRYHTSTLTKSAAAGTADSLAALSFVPKVGTKSLTQADWGNSLLLTQDLGPKTFLVRNTGDADLDFLVQGGVFADVAVVSGWVDAQEQGGFLTLAQGEEYELEIGRNYGQMRMLARVATSEASAADTDIEVELRGDSGSGRFIKL